MNMNNGLPLCTVIFQIFVEQGCISNFGGTFSFFHQIENRLDMTVSHQI